MKTLDEVINELEYEAKYNAGDWCELDSDALHYLKEYRDCGQCSYADSYLRCTQENSNAPLTWEQLKQMEGKSVWVEADDGKYKKWFIVGNFFSWFEKEDFDAHVNLYRSGGSMEMSKETYGSYWQAYRKERE